MRTRKDVFKALKSFINKLFPQTDMFRKTNELYLRIDPFFPQFLMQDLSSGLELLTEQEVAAMPNSQNNEKKQYYQSVKKSDYFKNQKVI